MAAARKTVRKPKLSATAREARVTNLVEASVYHFGRAYQALSSALDLDPDGTITLFTKLAKRSLVAPPPLAKTH